MIKAGGVTAQTNFGLAFKVIFCHRSDRTVKDRGLMTLTNFGPAFKVTVISLTSSSRIEV